MARDDLSPSIDNDGLPTQTEPGLLDIVRAEVRDEIRSCLTRLGIDCSAIAEPTEDDE